MIVGTLVCGTGAYATDPPARGTRQAGDGTSASHPRRPAAQIGAGSVRSSRPSLDLLEFLGEWETDSGEWLDPTGDATSLVLSIGEAAGARK